MHRKAVLLDTPGTSTTTHISKGFIGDEKLQFIQDVLFGLSQTKKCLSSKYFYDEEGSKIFQEIMQLQEYYLTRAETNILSEHKQALLEMVGNEIFNLIDLGSGDGVKTRILLEHLCISGKGFTYYPVDISSSILQTQLRELVSELPYMKVNALVGEYYDALSYLKDLAARGVMCLNTLSVGWDGYLYDCDFNQMLESPVATPSSAHIGDFDFEALQNREIVVNKYCYGCTAGAGSSCGGATV